MLRALVAMLAAAAVLAVPSAALAQGAGGDQYTDPLAGQPGADNGGGNGGNGGNGNTPSANTSQSDSAPGDDSSVASAQAGNQLPATGAEAWLLALAGAALLGGGLGLRKAADAGI